MESTLAFLTNRVYSTSIIAYIHGQPKHYLCWAQLDACQCREQIGRFKNDETTLEPLSRAVWPQVILSRGLQTCLLVKRHKIVFFTMPSQLGVAWIVINCSPRTCKLWSLFSIVLCTMKESSHVYHVSAWPRCAVKHLVAANTPPHVIFWAEAEIQDCVQLHTLRHCWANSTNNRIWMTELVSCLETTLSCTHQEIVPWIDAWTARFASRNSYSVKSAGSMWKILTCSLPHFCIYHI